jgi:hypothetical protein
MQMKYKNFLRWQFFSPVIIILMTVIIMILGTGNSHFWDMSPATAQMLTSENVWEEVYREIPDLPKENEYVSKITGQVTEKNTLVSRLIRYHIYNKGRSPIYRLDWKLTLADYLDVNETIYADSYPGNDSLRQNPLESDRIAISKLTRSQRNHLVQVLVNIFNPGNPKM